MKLIVALTAAALIAMPALAAPCRDAKGHFAKCPAAAAASAAPGVTKDAKGKCHAAATTGKVKRGAFVPCPK